DPKWLTSRVLRLPHKGHGTCSVLSRRVMADTSMACSAGGAMPKPFSACRPLSLSQSVVQAGDKRVSTRTSVIPRACSAATTSVVIWSMAGQPEYVGVMVTVQVDPSQTTSRIMPRSTTEITGISGSGTCSSHSIMRWGVSVCRVLTTVLLDRPVAETAFQPRYNPAPRYDGLQYRPDVPDAWPGPYQA